MSLSSSRALREKFDRWKLWRFELGVWILEFGFEMTFIFGYRHAEEEEAVQAEHARQLVAEAIAAREETQNLLQVRLPPYLSADISLTPYF